MIISPDLAPSCSSFDKESSSNLAVAYLMSQTFLSIASETLLIEVSEDSKMVVATVVSFLVAFCSRISPFT